MNLRYVEPTGHDYPKILDEVIAPSTDSGHSSCGTFNRRGTLLAVGCREGHINIWDFETRSIATRLVAHDSIVISVSWSRNGCKLLSADWSGLLLLWDVATSQVLIRVQFDIGVEHSWLHGRSSRLAMIHLHECQPLIVSFEKLDSSSTTASPVSVTHTIESDQRIKMVNHSAHAYRVSVQSLQLSQFIAAETHPHKTSKSTSTKKRKPPKKAKITCAVFDKCHRHIYCGTSNGLLLIIEYATWTVLNRSSKHKVTSNGQQIKSICFSRCGNYVVVNCGDRAIRYIDVADDGSSYTVRKQYSDAVDRKDWNCCCFSSNGEYICAASAKQHIIYIWQRVFETSFEQILKRPESVVVDMVWHPIQPILVSVTQSGEIEIWNESFQETGEIWSTFDANFQVLSSNVWFREKDRRRHVAMVKQKHHHQRSSNSSSGKSSMATSEDTSDDSEVVVAAAATASTGHHHSNDDMHGDGDAAAIESDEDIIDEEQWVQQQLNRTAAENMSEPDVAIDVFKPDHSLELWSGDEQESDMLDSAQDSLQHELVHLPINIQCPYTSQQLERYLADIETGTNEYAMQPRLQQQERVGAPPPTTTHAAQTLAFALPSMMEYTSSHLSVHPFLPSSSTHANEIKISHENKKVLQNLTKDLPSPGSHRDHHHQSNVKKSRKKKKQKIVKTSSCASGVAKQEQHQQVVPLPFMNSFSGRQIYHTPQHLQNVVNPPPIMSHKLISQKRELPRNHSGNALQQQPAKKQKLAASMVADKTAL